MEGGREGGREVNDQEGIRDGEKGWVRRVGKGREKETKKER